MLRAIKTFFQLHIDAEVQRPETSEHGLRLATAALLMEMTRADHTRRPEELVLVEDLVRRQFDLTEAETRELAELADAEAREAVSLYQFTGLINEHFSAGEKVRVVEMLWQVAYADRVLDKYEESLVRKVAELLYVPHRDFIRAKHRVQESLGLLT
jgi:uncharacterized tellurite resistance protein B-like protein